MAKIQISTLHKINSLLAKILELELLLESKNQENKDLDIKCSAELESYKLKTEEDFALKQNMALFSKNQDVLKSQEQELKLRTSKEIEILVDSFFEESVMKPLIEKIIASNIGSDYFIEADPAIANNLKLENTKVADQGVLNLVFGHKKYVLSKNLLADSLRAKLLEIAFN